jgi:transposase
MEAKSKKSPSAHDSATQSEPTDLPERWSAQRKTELVLRLLRGESFDSVSRDTQIPAHELESWKRAFLDAGMRGLKRHVEPEDRELIRTRAKIGELMMRLELAEDLIEKRGLVDEWKKRKP